MGKKSKRMVSCAALLLLSFFFLGSSACVRAGAQNQVSVIVKEEGLDFKGKKLAIPDFSVPEHGQDLGVAFADSLHYILMERSIFAEISRHLPVVWNHPGETLETNFAGLAETAAQRGYDYVLIGVVERLFYGGLEDTVLELKLRLVDCRTGKAVFVAGRKAVSKPSDPSYPLDTKLTMPADSPRRLAEKTLRQIVERLL